MSKKKHIKKNDNGQSVGVKIKKLKPKVVTLSKSVKNNKAVARINSVAEINHSDLKKPIPNKKSIVINVQESGVTGPEKKNVKIKKHNEILDTECFLYKDSKIETHKPVADKKNVNIKKYNETLKTKNVKIETTKSVAKVKVGIEVQKDIKIKKQTNPMVIKDFKPKIIKVDSSKPVVSDNSDMDDVDLSDSNDESDKEICQDSDIENVDDSNDSSNNDIKNDENSNSSDTSTNYTEPIKKVNSAYVKKLVTDIEIVKDKKNEISKKSAEAKLVTNVILDKKTEESKDLKKVESYANIQKVIDPNTESGKILIEINKRRERLSECLVHVKNIARVAKPEELTKNLTNVVSIDLPKNSKKKEKHRGYGFFRFANAIDAAKAMPIINSTTLHDKQMVASKFVLKKAYNDISHVDFTKIHLTSFKYQDITDLVKGRFLVGVTVKKINIVTYELTFVNKGDAMAMFRKETIIIDGNNLLVNFLYNLHETYDNSIIPVATVSSVKRSQPNSFNEIVAKKSKGEAVVSAMIVAGNATKTTDNQAKKKKKHKKKSHNKEKRKAK